MLAVFALLSVFFTVIAGPNYFVDILRHRTKPHRMTWFIFSLIGSTAFVSQLAIGGRWSIIFTGVDALGSIATFLLSLRYGVGGWKAEEKLALGFALCGITLSVVVKAPLIALSGAILADVCAVALTVRKTYLHPESESQWVWISVGIGAIFSALAVGKWDFGLLLFPVYLAVANLSIPLAKLFGRRATSVSEGRWLGRRSN